MINKKNKKKANSRSKLGAERQSAPNKKRQETKSFTFDDEIIIGIPRKQDINKKNQTKKNNNLKPKKVKKLTQKQIMRRKIILKIIKWTSLIAIFTGIILYILMSPLFNVKKITVNIDKKLSKEEIINLSAINLNQNIFKYTKKQIINNIKENAYVEDVTVKRNLPDEIQITVKERVPTYMITYGNAYVYVNNQGYMLEVSSEYKNLPILKGIKTQQEKIEIGKRLCNEDLQKLSTVIKIMELAQSNEISDLITAIDISDNYDIKLIMEEEDKTVHLGDCSMLDERILWVKTILKKEQGVPGEIFVNMNLNIENPFFRERV